MTDEEIDNLTLEQYNDIEEQHDQRNAWSVSREVARRLDGAPCMGEHIKATAESFFWNKEYIENTKLSSKEGDSWILLCFSNHSL